jgi:site-specific DNA-cytosine methylase
MKNNLDNQETNYAKLSVLDLFSGIGGFALALKGDFITQTYCEKDPIAREVLLKNMKEGYIDKAPIVNDIVNFEPSQPYDICAFGWPCIGFSSAGKREQFDNPQSALFYKVIQILRAQPIPYLIMENVPAVSKAMPEILDLLCNELNYSVFWVTVSAAVAVGAPHQRLRWYGLAIHKSASPFNLPYALPSVYDFSVEPCPRTSADLMFVEAYGRVSLLGNSIVSQAVTTAWNHLVFYAQRIYVSYGIVSSIDNRQVNLSITNCEQSSDEYFQSLIEKPSVVLRRIARKKPIKDITKVNAGYCLRAGPFVNNTNLDVMRIQDWQTFAQEKNALGELIAAPPGIVERLPYAETLCFDNSYLRQRKKNKSQVLPALQGPVYKKRWGTPTHSLRGRAHVLTRRTVNQLTTQIAFERNTVEREAPINPCFVEFLMGYPLNYTALPDRDWEKLKKERLLTFKRF